MEVSPPVVALLECWLRHFARLLEFPQDLTAKYGIIPVHVERVREASFPGLSLQDSVPRMPIFAALLKVQNKDDQDHPLYLKIIEYSR